MATTADFRNGMTIRLDRDLFSIVEFQHVKPGKGGAFVRTRLKNVRTGAVLDRTFRAGERVEDVRLEKKSMQYLYRAEELHYFMDNETFEQLALAAELIGDDMKFLKENQIVSVLMDGNNPIGIELPFFVELEVVQTDPGLRGDTVSGGSKPGVLETGATIQIPLFINVGDVVKVDTRSETYVERVETGN